VESTSSEFNRLSTTIARHSLVYSSIIANRHRRDYNISDSPPVYA